MSQLTIGFISQDWSKFSDSRIPNGCTWYRCVLPSNALNALGHQTHVGAAAVLGKDKFGLLDDLNKIVSGHKILVFKLPMHISNLKGAEIAIASGQKIVVDIDDWFDNLPETNRAKQITDPEANPTNNRNIYFAVIELAHALICSTPFLRDYYTAKYPGKPVFMVRNSIDIKRWPNRKTRKSVPTIGWVGATPWRANDLEQLSTFFNQYLIDSKNKFHHSGHIDKAPIAAQLLGITSKSTAEPMKPITELPSLFERIDIGIVPLNNIEFNHAKSYLKGLEYAAAGIPFVSSYSPEYQFLADAGIGRVANSAEEWIYHLDELQDFLMRDDEAKINREIIYEQFSIEKKVNEWVDVYTKIMDL